MWLYLPLSVLVLLLVLLLLLLLVLVLVLVLEPRRSGATLRGGKEASRGVAGRRRFAEQEHENENENEHENENEGRIGPKPSMPPSPLPPPIPRDRPVGRYAPSPTGDLHLGNLRTALIAWRRIRDAGGIFILRIEDIDLPRNVPGAEERILEDLRRAGIDWDEGPDVGGPAGPYRQSERGAIYEAALAELERRGRVYPCACSRKDLREAGAPHGPEGPAYPGTCRRRAGEPCLARPPGDAAIRFRLDDPSGSAARPEGAGVGSAAGRSVEFEDDELGRVRHDLGSLCGDFVVRRRDGLWAYQLACAIDDALMGVTHVVRGGDLATSASRQIALLRALDLAPPRYAHLPLVTDERGERLAKRDGALSLRAMLEDAGKLGGGGDDDAGTRARDAAWIRERILAAPTRAVARGTLV